MLIYTLVRSAAHSIIVFVEHFPFSILMDGCAITPLPSNASYVTGVVVNLRRKRETLKEIVRVRVEVAVVLAMEQKKETPTGRQLHRRLGRS